MRSHFSGAKNVLRLTFFLLQSTVYILLLSKYASKFRGGGIFDTLHGLILTY